MVMFCGYKINFHWRHVMISNRNREHFIWCKGKRKSKILVTLQVVPFSLFHIFPEWKFYPFISKCKIKPEICQTLNFQMLDFFLCVVCYKRSTLPMRDQSISLSVKLPFKCFWQLNTWDIIVFLPILMSLSCFLGRRWWFRNKPQIQIYLLHLLSNIASRARTGVFFNFCGGFFVYFVCF